MTQPKTSRRRDRANVALLVVFLAAVGYLLVTFGPAGWTQVAIIVAVAAVIGLVLTRLRRR